MVNLSLRIVIMYQLGVTRQDAELISYWSLHPSYPTADRSIKGAQVYRRRKEGGGGGNLGQKGGQSVSPSVPCLGAILHKYAQSSGSVKDKCCALTH